MESWAVRAESQPTSDNLRARQRHNHPVHTIHCCCNPTQQRSPLVVEVEVTIVLVVVEALCSFLLPRLLFRILGSGKDGMYMALSPIHNQEEGLYAWNLGLYGRNPTNFRQSPSSLTTQSSSSYNSLLLQSYLATITSSRSRGHHCIGSGGRLEVFVASAFPDPGIRHGFVTAMPYRLPFLSFTPVYIIVPFLFLS